MGNGCYSSGRRGFPIAGKFSMNYMRVNKSKGSELGIKGGSHVHSHGRNCVSAPLSPGRAPSSLIPPSGLPLQEHQAPQPSPLSRWWATFPPSHWEELYVHVSRDGHTPDQLCSRNTGRENGWFLSTPPLARYSRDCPVALSLVNIPQMCKQALICIYNGCY